MSVSITTVVFLLPLLLVSAVAQPPPPPSPSCTDELVLFSPCLPYVSAPPNNLTATANFQCCSIFSASIDSGVGACLCYLLRQPMILGFPLDRSRVLSLSQVCNDVSSDESLESLCSTSESPELPPLQSIQFTTPSDSGNEGALNSASPPVGLPPETATASSSSNVISPEPALISPPPPHPPPPFIPTGATASPKIFNFWFLLPIAVLLYTHSSSIHDETNPDPLATSFSR